MPAVIEVDGISKLYTKGRSIATRSLRDSFHEWWYRLCREEEVKSTPQESKIERFELGPTPNSFWALRDVSFDVAEGEIVGILGKNGTGKSTLLKILARLTEPTEGRASMRGKVASFLEVGTGFHPDLTGRENIYLNGAFLGMKRKEIERSFDDIVAFAEISQFVDTRVKFYSSGMNMRLAFSIMMHLNADILLMDEILEVLDDFFKERCLKRMRERATQGKTILLVTHLLENASRICDRTIVMSRGRAFEGASTDLVSETVVL